MVPFLETGDLMYGVECDVVPFLETGDLMYGVECDVVPLCIAFT
jgi:hypothetical protein